MSVFPPSMATTPHNPQVSASNVILEPSIDTDGTSQRAKWQLSCLLRFLGFIDLLALLAVVMPLKWMSFINEICGMGAIPETSLMGYLTRTTSCLYGFHGAMILYISQDVDRYAPLIRFMSWLAIGHGFVLLGIDLAESMPWFWTVLEAPSFISIGILTLLIQTRIDRRQCNAGLHAKLLNGTSNLG